MIRVFRLQLATDARYSVYLKRQELDIAAFRKDEGIAIPPNFAFAALPGLSTELSHKLERSRPGTLGQAARLDGMTPAALDAAARTSQEGPGRQKRLEWQFPSARRHQWAA